VLPELAKQEYTARVSCASGNFILSFSPLRRHKGRSGGLPLWLGGFSLRRVLFLTGLTLHYHVPCLQIMVSFTSGPLTGRGMGGVAGNGNGLAEIVVH
jgi:hypothetical protein